MATALQIGAGNIGRGFLGELFFRSGYQTAFVDVDRPLVEALRRRRAYDLTIVAGPGEPAEARQVLRIDGVSALHPDDREHLLAAFAECAVLGVSVGVANLEAVAALVADGVRHRLASGGGPLNGIVCENLIGSGRHLKALVLARVPEQERERVSENLGLAEAVVARMVPLVTEEDRKRDPLYVAVEPYNVLPVDATAFVGTPPEIYNVQPIADIEAYQARKLFAFNAAHAIFAYTGYQRGFRYVWEAVEDAEVRSLVQRALSESLGALARKFSLPLGQLKEEADDFVTRFGNRNLGDTIRRVGRDPVRKLGPDERLIGAARLALSQGITPEAIVTGIVAALHYDEPTDPQAQRLTQMLRQEGLGAVLTQVCRLEPGEPLETMIQRAYNGGGVGC